MRKKIKVITQKRKQLFSYVNLGATLKISETSIARLKESKANMLREEV